MTAQLTIENIYTAYDRADVLSGISLTVEPGSITCLMGSNGSGKTTLIRSILALTFPRQGRIVFDGIDITGLPTTGSSTRGSPAFRKVARFSRN